MKNYRHAFTMIELIFVIVILGVLAAVAIPKLAATRDDAEVSKIAQNIMVGASEIAAYAIAHAKTDDNLSKMSRGVSSLVKTGNAVLDNNKTLTIPMGSILDCVTMRVVTGVYDDNLTISFGNAGGDSKCLQLQSAIDAKKYPMKLRGASVKY